MADIVKQIVTKPIQLADEASSKTEKLSGLLRQAARASNERPTRRIIDDTDQILKKALVLV